MSLNKNQLSLPGEKPPECWKDEARMNVLFAPVRNRSVNPQDWESKLGFWSSLIFDCCVHSQVYTFKIDDLKRLFNVEGRSPSCLAIVVEEMYRLGEIKPVTDFLQKPAETWSRWAADIFIKKPIVWSYSKVKNTLISPSLNDNTFVHIAAVEANAEKLLSSLPEQYINKIISLQELIDTKSLEPPKIDDFKLVLHHLVCKNKADIKDISNGKDDTAPQNLLIKFGDIKKVKPISDNDVSIHILQQNEKLLSGTIEKLEAEVESLISDAKSYLSKGQRQMAKSCLRKKHEIELRIAKRGNALQNIQTLLLKIHDVESDSHVIDSYKIALSSLKKTFKDSNISEDSVSETMTEISDVLDEHEEIQATLAQPVVSPGDEEELEAELTELMADDNGDHTSPPSSPIKLPLKDDTISLEKRLELLRLPLVSSEVSTTDQTKDTVLL